MLPGSDIIYKITAQNHGQGAAENLEVSAQVPPGSVYVGGGTYANGIVTWTIPALNSGASMAVTVQRAHG